jgi:hypothetical protein
MGAGKRAGQAGREAGRSGAAQREVRKPRKHEGDWWVAEVSPVEPWSTPTGNSQATLDFPNLRSIRIRSRVGEAEDRGRLHEQGDQPYAVRHRPWPSPRGLAIFLLGLVITVLGLLGAVKLNVLLSARSWQ